MEKYGGLWQRMVNYEPRDVVADTASGDGSLILWFQTPCGPYIDIRDIRAEGKARGFSGVSSSSSVANATTNSTVERLEWQRFLDSKPDSCPSGNDAADARWIGSDVLLEEGDGYLEVWHRLAVWDPANSSVSWQPTSEDSALVNYGPGAPGTLTVTIGGWTATSELRNDGSKKLFLKSSPLRSVDTTIEF